MSLIVYIYREAFYGIFHDFQGLVLRLKLPVFLFFVVCLVAVTGKEYISVWVFAALGVVAYALLSISIYRHFLKHSESDAQALNMNLFLIFLTWDFGVGLIPTFIFYPVLLGASILGLDWPLPFLLIMGLFAALILLGCAWLLARISFILPDRAMGKKTLPKKYGRCQMTLV